MRDSQGKNANSGKAVLLDLSTDSTLPLLGVNVLWVGTCYNLNLHREAAEDFVFLLIRDG